MNTSPAPDSARQAALLEEYRTLRAESEHSSQERLRLLAFSGTAWAALATWLVSNSSYFAAEVALLVLHAPLVLAYILIKLLNRHVMRVSTYIRQFIEPEVPGLHWETRVAAFQRASSLVLSTSQVTGLALLLMSTASIALVRALSLAPRFASTRWLDITIIVVLWLAFIALELPVLLESGSRGYESTADSMWRRLIDEEGGKRRAPGRDLLSDD